jgi:hypothetical protein
VKGAESKILNVVAESVFECKFVVNLFERYIPMDTGDIYIRRLHSFHVVTFTAELEAAKGWAKPSNAVSTSGCRCRPSIGWQDRVPLQVAILQAITCGPDPCPMSLYRGSVVDSPSADVVE